MLPRAGAAASGLKSTMTGCLPSGPGHRRPGRRVCPAVPRRQHAAGRLSGRASSRTRRQSSIYPVHCEAPLLHEAMPAIVRSLSALDVPPPAYVFESPVRLPAGICVHFRPLHEYGRAPPLPDHRSRIVSAAVYIEDLGQDPLATLGPVLDPALERRGRGPYPDKVPVRGTMHGPSAVAARSGGCGHRPAGEIGARGVRLWAIRAAAISRSACPTARLAGPRKSSPPSSTGCATSATFS